MNENRYKWVCNTPARGAIHRVSSLPWEALTKNHHRVDTDYNHQGWINTWEDMFVLAAETLKENTKIKNTGAGKVPLISEEIADE